MIRIGYKLCSEEQTPQELLQCARQAEEAGFEFAMISDHFHPWIDRQGQSSFVWGVLGGISQVTEHLEIGTAVTCPTVRTHPAIIAQAAATASMMLPGRFLLGLGSGENLNEHIFADHWPEAAIRLSKLEEAVAVIRLLWQGGQQSHYGRYYTLENARIYSLPERLPPIMIAASGAKAADLAGRCGDGLISTAPDAEVREKFESAGGNGKPCYAEMAVCWAEDKKTALKTAFECWPNIAVKGELSQILPTPAHFEQASKMVTEEDVSKQVFCGPDPAPYLAGLQEYQKSGFTHVFLHQIGPDQRGFFQFCEREIFPRLRKAPQAESQPGANRAASL